MQLFLGSVSNRLESSAFIYPQPCLWGGSETFIGLNEHSVGTYTQLIQLDDKKKKSTKINFHHLILITNDPARSDNPLFPQFSNFF